MDSALERLGNGCKEEDDRGKDEANDELHRGARTDKHAEADEEQLQTTGWSDRCRGRVESGQKRVTCLLPGFDHFPPVH